MLQHLQELAEEDSHRHRLVPVDSVNMSEIIAEMGLDAVRKEAMVCTKYKIVEKKVKQFAGPLPSNNKRKRKEVSRGPLLRKFMDIGHTFTNETRKILHIGGGRFLLKNEEGRFREMLEQHAKAFAFTPKEIWCVDPKDSGADGDLHD